jgi:flagellar basal-body rod modification protein FlgD
VTVTGNAAISGNSTDPNATTGTRESRMGQDAFLKLLTTQLANQDPLQPQENGEFLAQLAQFTSLEKLTSIETSIKELATAFKTLAGLPEAPADNGASTGTGTGN